MPSGTNILPSIPLRKNNGTNDATIIKVEFRIGILTSREASYTTLIILFCWLIGNCRFSLSRLKIFSTSTMASSTSEPMAMAIPPSDIVLIVRPRMRSVKIENRIESGMVTNEMTVVRTFIRNRNNTITTKMAPSKRALFTLPIELSMKRDWRNKSVAISTSAGRLFFISSSAASMRAVSARVFVAGCLVTVIITAGSPRCDARPNFGALLPIFTSAISSSFTGTRSTVLTTAFAICSTSSVSSTPRMIYSLPYW